MPDTVLLSHVRSLSEDGLTLDALEAWARGFAPFGRVVCARVAVVCAELALPYWQRTFPDVLIPGMQLDAVREWLRDPSAERLGRVATMAEYEDVATDNIDPRDDSRNAEGAAADACLWTASVVVDDDPSVVFVAVRAAVHALDAAGESGPERTVHRKIREALDPHPDAGTGSAADEPQGALLECVYCTHVRPGLGAECPRCHGAGPRLRPARMMDRPSSREAMLRALYRAGPAGLAFRGPEGDGSRAAADAYRDLLLDLLEKAVLHGFDLVEALAEEIRRVEGVLGEG